MWQYGAFCSAFPGGTETFKQWADFPPARDPSFTGVLTQCRLQEEHRNSTCGKIDQVREDESTCVR